MAKKLINIEHHPDLKEYLESRQLVPQGRRIDLSNLHGGVSNRTVLVTIEGQGGWVVKQALEKLRVAADWFSDPVRVHREAAGIRWLSRLLWPGAVPDFVFEDEDQHILIMQAVPQPHENYKTLLLEHPPQPRHVSDFAGLLATLHCNAYSRKPELEGTFADTSFFENLRLEPYYSYSARQLPEAAPFLFELISDTRARKLTLVHGDYSPKNILIHNDHLILLDHEVIRIGDPAFDIGFSLAHLLSKAHFLIWRRDEFRKLAQTYWQTYFSLTRGEPWAAELETLCLRHSLGCLLARVAGKSVLEYLSFSQKAAQRMVVMQLINEQPAGMTSLINQFTEMLSHYE